MEKSLRWPPFLFHLFLIQMMCLDLGWNSVGRGHEIFVQKMIFIRLKSHLVALIRSASARRTCGWPCRAPSSRWCRLRSCRRGRTPLWTHWSAVRSTWPPSSLRLTVVWVWDNFGLVCIVRYRILLIRTRHAFSLSASLDKGCYSIVVNIYICSITIQKCTSMFQHQTFLNHILHRCG